MKNTYAILFYIDRSKANEEGAMPYPLSYLLQWQEYIILYRAIDAT